MKRQQRRTTDFCSGHWIIKIIIIIVVVIILIIIAVIIVTAWIFSKQLVFTIISQN